MVNDKEMTPNESAGKLKTLKDVKIRTTWSYDANKYPIEKSDVIKVDAVRQIGISQIIWIDKWISMARLGALAEMGYTEAILAEAPIEWKLNPEKLLESLILIRRLIMWDKNLDASAVLVGKLSETEHG
jgi:hypothetical protein